MRNSNVFFRAWAIKKLNPQFTFRKALILAWRSDRLTRSMSEGNIVEFVYIKTDGSIRIASGTIPQDETTEKKSKSFAERSLKQQRVVNYFDTDADGWRSFRVDQLTAVFN